VKEKSNKKIGVELSIWISDRCCSVCDRGFN